ncbi:MAG: hypothetical protein LQ345_004580 [Seirophora villosa]|nr:MAG: hypothetical protein LQ345_004580 [Seirophora villosa]
MQVVFGILALCWTSSLCVRAADSPTALFSPALFAPGANFTSSSAANRIDPPPTVTARVKENGPGVPPDTIVFSFDNVRMDADDVTMAVVAMFKVACERLSAESGRERARVGQDFRISDRWYRFELGWDQHEDDRPFVITELRTIIMAIAELNRNYNMRQITLKYLRAGRFHVIGRLRNPATPPPPRQDAARPARMAIPNGEVLWLDYGRPMDFDVVVNAMMGLFSNCWDTIVRFRKPAARIIADTSPFTYEDSRLSVRFEVSAPPMQLNVDNTMDMAYYAVNFGRIFFMKEHHCALLNTYYPTPVEVTSSLSKKADGISADAAEDS